jgi:2,5-dioxopentanoate dehydrogenase
VATTILHGKNIIGSDLSADGHGRFNGKNPRQSSALAPEFHEASPGEITHAAELAASAAPILSQLEAEKIASLLEAIREEIIALGDALIEKADEETALGLDRLRGERDRTAGQLKLFAGIVREGSWVDARLDTPQPDRKPLPKPDLRRMLQPIGPVAVFGASNFPLAFSVAGGDTASALATRNPVIVKAHPAHPGSSEMVGAAIARAVAKESLPPGTFSLLHGVNPEVSLALVTNSRIKAVAFTGSLRAGRALFDAAAKRPDPIPVFAEMGSVNPMFLLPSAVQAGAQGLAEAFYKSVTLGVGQFCTCPGLAFSLEGENLDGFLGHLGKHFGEASPATMLTGGIAKAYAEGFEKVSKIPGVQSLSASKAGNPQNSEGRPGLVITDSRTWREHQELREEVFGPATVVVRCVSSSDMLDCAKTLEGSLTATLHGNPQELTEQKELLGVLSAKAGRVIFNGFPTGVEVGNAMQHGGPYPATTDPRFTSVGATAIYRFARPVCYQNFPEEALPTELQKKNPRGIWRNVDGQLTKEPLA